ncbi:MAG TPA: His/Gly/Thr/Pro-type tRNA ligase C-terminal domain-containing protein, partial [Chitinophagales bacterium]|nr:His/Gly/Thr/Pro-type tRNA ligase C-terminal domain-containing protein [Chitinophagales bacterium]
EYAEAVVNVLKKHEIRTTLDTRSEKIGRKIRDAEVKKVPCMLIIGEQEMMNGTVSLRKHGEGDKGSMSPEDFAKSISEEVAEVFA